MIPNLLEVEPGIYRGGQPDSDGWDYLKDLGVDTVIKLNLDSEGSDEKALELGMTLARTPINGVEQVLTEPELNTLRGNCNIIGPGTFIHCTHGQDRTGLQVGYFRVLRCNWTKADAWQEMRLLGFHCLLFGLLKAWADLPDNQKLHD